MFSSYSGDVDKIFLIIILISVGLLILITCLMVGFVIKYHRNRHPEPVEVHGNILLEIIWIIVPTILVLGMFYYGYEGFKLMRTVPKDAMTVEVTGRMWDWSFKYENGKKTKDLLVPINKAVKLLLNSVDVLHSFYIPAFRIKEDVVPGKENYLWFKPQALGPTDIFCAEFCGQRHAYMMSKVIVMTQLEFDEWYKSEVVKKDDSLKTRALGIMENYGCLGMGCHTLDTATTNEQISFKGIYGKSRTVLFKGEEKNITVDENYILRSIQTPELELLKGRNNDMPNGADLGITEAEIKILIEYLKGLQ